VVSAPVPDLLWIAELDAGEAAVIALARAKSPCMAVIDEKRGRHVYEMPVKFAA
jgi:predicted nucleic acid-binding protein